MSYELAIRRCDDGLTFEVMMAVVVASGRVHRNMCLSQRPAADTVATGRGGAHGGRGRRRLAGWRGEAILCGTYTDTQIERFIVVIF